ncbi:hypothetical protein C6P40_003353 [Pichia californica]|uniref:Chromosome segregation in meiosis protein n=1 Tax=Pichia californica TaxID=460514 RepID=A0A9P6WJ95_9ASCO|nr:hypothetical protein C6P42_004590 [[Candida] californica]KAG0686798.1 hypothetical protein C6P40_003353 [[Candida] californica]
MSETDRLSNDAILGININLNNDQGPTSILDPSLRTSIDSVNTTTTTTTTTANKRRNRSDKLSSEILLSGRGLPKLINQFKKFKFKKRLKNQDNFNLTFKKKFKNNLNYCDDHHFLNLQRILTIYQSFGHDLLPHLKFDRFITNLNKGVEDSFTRSWIRNQIKEEMRIKMENQSIIENEREINQLNSHKSNDIDNNNAEEEEEEEEWPELFGGDSNINNNDNDNATTNVELSDNEIEISQIRQTPMYSTFLRTSSQPIPSDNEEINNNNNNNKDNKDNGDLDAFDALVETEGGFGLQDILSDEENENNNSNFSQYLAEDSVKDKQVTDQLTNQLNSNDADVTPENQQQQQQQSNQFSDDDFSDDDDALI